MSLDILISYLQLISNMLRAELYCPQQQLGKLQSLRAPVISLIKKAAISNMLRAEFEAVADALVARMSVPVTSFFWITYTYGLAIVDAMFAQ